MGDPLSPRQRQLHEYMCKVVRQWRVPPTFAEMARELGISGVSTNGAIAGHLSRMKRKGAVKQARGLWWPSDMAPPGAR